MRKLYETYSSNPALQKNQAEIQKELVVAQTELNQIATTLAKYQVCFLLLVRLEYLPPYS